MINDFADYQAVLQGVAKQRPRVEEVLAGITGKKLSRVFLVGCGGSLAVMHPVKYLFDRYGGDLTAGMYSSSDFLANCADNLDGKTLVILSSHSGNTPETVAAAQLAREQGAVTIGLSRSPDSTLGQKVDYCFSYGAEVGITDSKMMFLHMITFCLLRANPALDYEAGMAMLERLPELLVGVKSSVAEAGQEFARRHRNKKTIYTVAAGPLYGMAYAFAICILLEMQWINSAPFNAAEFFHGPFEIFEPGVPLLVLLGEDNTRPLAERVASFAGKYTDYLTLIDNRDFALPGLSGEQRALAAPFVGWAVLYRYAQFLEAEREHSLDLRRYMGVVEY